MNNLRAADVLSVDMIRRLVAFNTVSRNPNRDIIDFIHAYLAGLGVEARIIPGAEEGKACLLATVGPAGRPGIVLSGHTDVVPVDGEAWSSDPFAAEVRDGKLYGRGCVDMKGFLGIVLAHVPMFLASNLKTPIHLAFSYDEEVGCIGVRPMIEVINRMPVKPALCFVGEPTRMTVMTGHKGKKSMRVTVRGHECHSSLAPTGVNAVEYAAELIAFIKGLARRLERDGARDGAYDIPHTTAHVGRIAGGTALNIVPRDCWFEFEFRVLPADDPEALLAEVREYAERTLEPQMKAIDPKTGFSWLEIGAFPGLDTSADAQVVGLATRFAGNSRTGRVAFGTEGGLFAATAGIPTVICGPGDIDQAHKPDEFITLDEIARGEAFVRAVADFCARETL
jgi:acetylornithine deacetylase